MTDGPTEHARPIAARLAAVLSVLLFAVGCAALAPSQPATGTPGGPGPCRATSTDLVNPVDDRLPLTVVVPSGSGEPWAGGRCDGPRRPVVVVAHGYTGGSVAVYEGLVDHLVSNGFVVVFPGYTTDYGPEHQYAVVDGGFTAAVAWLGERVDTSRVGVVGHSFGGGMAPWLLQQAAGRGWGGDALWAVSFAPWFAFGVGDGPIELPPHVRAAVVAYDRDRVVDARIGIEMFQALTVPGEQRRHVTVRSDTSGTSPLVADHYGPVSMQVPAGYLSTDHLDRWSTFPIVDATARCSLEGVWCDADLSFVGVHPDGRPVRPAVVSDHPVDLGPPASQECDSALNPRQCP